MNKQNVILVNVPIMSDFNCLLYTAYKWEYFNRTPKFKWPVCNE